MRRCELAGTRRDLLDLDGGTLQIEPTRVGVSRGGADLGRRTAGCRRRRAASSLSRRVSFTNPLTSTGADLAVSPSNSAVFANQVRSGRGDARFGRMSDEPR
jgi:hypothetical protein